MLAALDAVDLNLSDWKRDALVEHGLDWILDLVRATLKQWRA